MLVRFSQLRGIASELGNLTLGWLVEKNIY